MSLLFILLALLIASCVRLVRRKTLGVFDKSAVQPLRGLLALLVVLGHSFDAKEMSQYSFAYSAVSIFFFISGYGLMQKRLRADGKPLCGGFLHAFAKLTPAFLIASVAYSVWIVFRGGTVPLWHNIVTGSSSLPIPFTWYVPAIFALYGIFYLSDRICRKDKTMLVCAIIGVAFYWVLTALVFGWPFYWWKAVGGFVAGLVIALNEGRLRNVLAKSPRMVFMTAALVLLGICGLACSAYFPLRFAADHLFLAVLGPVVVLAMYELRIPRFFGFFGVISYEMYIVHGAFV